MLKDKSFYKTSPLGDEAATRNFGANILNHSHKGKTYFKAWSMDVKAEGLNVCRHIDITTSNHSSDPGGAAIPMTNLSAKEAGQTESPICECCKQPLHDSQKGGKVISEEEFYGVRPQDKPVPKLPEGSLKPKVYAKELKKLEEQYEEALENYGKRQKEYRNAVRLQKQGCKALPEPPCNTYRIVTSDQNEHGRGVFNEAKANIQKILNVPLVRLSGRGKEGSKARRRKTSKKSATINHRVPLCAGGCPTNVNNLVSSHTMNDACWQATDDLDKLQDKRIPVLREAVGI